MPTVRTAADPVRLLLVTEGAETARDVAALLGDELGAGLRSCIRPDEAPAQAGAHRAEVVVLALPSLADVERHAQALRQAPSGATRRPFLLALCDTASTSAAASLCREGVIDDYVQHYPAPADPDRLGWSVRLAASVAESATSAGATDKASRVPARRSTVLVVEDDEVLHALVAAMLEAEPLDLVFEPDGEAALERIRSVAPDLVLMDVMLPGGGDGVAITQQVKAAPDLAAIPVVMLTGEARMDTLMRSMEAGAADFIVKPFTREALVAKVAKYLPVAA